MKINETLSGQLAKIWMFLMMGVSMSANAGLFGFGGTNWKEEVLLHDGTKIIAERTVNRGGGHEIGQPAPIKEQTIRFALPRTSQTLTWEDPFSEDVGGASFLPMLLDISKGSPYIVATPMGCLAHNKWGRPNPPYVIFKHNGKTWQRIPLQELPAEISTPNLISSAPDIEVKKLMVETVSADFIKQWTAEFKQPEFKTILREPIVKKGPEGCPEMIYNGHGGWNSVDIFKSQPSFEACKQFCKLQKMTNQICPCDSIFSRK